MDSKPTIRKIAELAKVSIGTVDRVLHKRGYVAPKTREIVEGIMKKIDYVPNTYARSLVLNKTFNIAVLLPQHNEGEYWHYPFQGVKKAINDFKSLGLKINVYLYDLNKSNSFNNVCKKVLLEKNDAALLFPDVMPAESASFINKCKDKHIPFVLIGSYENKTEAILNIGQNSYQGGRLAGQLLNHGNNNSAKYLIINILKADTPNHRVNKRIEGFKAFLSEQKSKDIIVDTFTITEEDTQLIKKIKTKIDSIPEINGVFVPNSKSYMIAEVLKENKSMKIVGYDLLQKNKDLINKGIIDFLINQQPSQQTYQGIELLYRYLVMNETPPAIIDIPLDIVCKEKLMYYKDNF
jgi:LacI family transcriptional regulator